jgi:hypothetical protein
MLRAANGLFLCLMACEVHYRLGCLLNKVELSFRLPGSVQPEMKKEIDYTCLYAGLNYEGFLDPPSTAVPEYQRLY